MKLEKILDKLGSLEKNSFIKVIDNIISKNPENNKEIDKILSSADKGLKSVDSQNISKIFLLTQNEFYNYLKSEFQDTSSQLDILIDIIIRDGNCIMKQDWFSRLYDNEIKHLKNRLKQLKSDLDNDKSELSESRKRDYKIYNSCLKTAYNNDLINNREAKITFDELSIILTLSKSLGLSQEEVKLINYTIIPIKKDEILEIINSLKNIGVIFYSKKENTVYVADEIVRLLRKLREKEVGDKFLRRTLKIMRQPTINQISKIHNINRKLGQSEKIEEIIKEGVSIRGILENDIYKEGTTLTEKKKQLTELCEKGLGIKSLKGSTLDDKIDSLISHFENIEKDEKVGISIDGYEKMLIELNESLPKLNKQLKEQFELQDEFVLKANFLLDYNIKPRDILDLIAKEDLTKFTKEYGIKQRGDDILNVLENYKDAENLYLENYENVAYRNLNELKENGISIKESELGLKFEELTKTIFSKLGFNVDEKLKKSINTSKDQIDILLNIDNNEVIIVECKTSKERGYNKFSSVSRQIKSYRKLAESCNLRVIKTLLVAPEFSDDFITDCEMDMEMNLSLITASSLMKIFEEFKISKHTSLPHVLFRDIVINEERIIKALKKK
ncbi:restriction endonuclease [Muricauda sp. SCSIO 64092]|uniref:restriction endonuclease n=1 Tax=Allomuricauda sp. SCSIO 64092 TaxID=2908842 RepID=UPI001FF49CBB|nr:restriction endonuclease [Muricauda sp. SCSIO 64092]UOY08075.1 restriction endonuclease [Muricauda sp. SCSIO 64092]